MVEITIAYESELRCAAVHQPSGAQIRTDAPKDNHGKGESFSPTDLVATALGACMLTIMGIAASALQIDMRGARVSVKKEMTADPVRRISALTVVIEIPLTLNNEQKQKLINAALSCPVHKSLHPDIRMPIEWRWH